MSRIHSKSPWPWLLSALLVAVLAACSQPLSSHHPRPMTESAERASMSADSAVVAKDMSVMRLQSVRAEEKLGTRWGDEVQSNVRRVHLRRVSQEPLAQNVLHYSSKDYRGRSVNSISLAAGRVELSVRGDGRRELPIFRDNGSYYLRGINGQAYRLIYRNNSSQTFEIVASVDGLDVLSGKPGS